MYPIFVYFGPNVPANVYTIWVHGPLNLKLYRTLEGTLKGTLVVQEPYGHMDPWGHMRFAGAWLTKVAWASDRFRKSLRQGLGFRVFGSQGLEFRGFGCYLKFSGLGVLGFGVLGFTLTLKNLPF